MDAISRRRFLKSSAALGGALVLGFRFDPHARAADAPTVPPAAPTRVAPNAFLRIGKDGTCTVVVKHTELGQGSSTALPMLVAEELECDWSKVRFELAPAHPDYLHTEWGMMATGGSSGVSNSWEQLRVVGAQARTMLMQAAANQWKVNVSAVRAEKGFVVGPGGKRLSYGQLAEAAAKLAPPQQVTLKAAKDFKVIGKPMRRIDAAEKVNGTAVFGLDVHRTDLHTALVERAPVFGARVASLNAEKVKGVPGVTHVVELPAGVAVVARSFWAARQGREALEVQWKLPEGESVSTESLSRKLHDLARTPGKVAQSAKDARALASAARRIEAEYELPYLAHAAMEPLNCTVELRANAAEIWTGSQAQIQDQEAAARVLGLEPSRVRLNTVLAGGGFGRRNNPGRDIVVEACEIATKAKVPLKLVWTREDDMRSGWYRPMMVHRIEAGLDASGTLVAWKQVVAGSPIVAGAPPEAVAKMTFDPSAREGVVDSPYAIANLQLESHPVETAVPVLWWRSVGYSHGVFAVESMIDEVAAATGKDPVALRRELLAKNERVLRVLDLAAARSGWGTSLPAGRARGVAVSELRGSVCVQVAEVALESGKPRVHRVVAAMDCGLVVNPLTVESQVHGAIVFGLSAALHGKITLKGGRVEQSNFHDYPLLRMSEMPRIEVHLVAGAGAPTGVGEVGTPAIAPAVGNALFALTGKRARTLPFGDTKWA